ncbi:MAG: CubicO group peptidase (beta-lactamase class C family) [Colwellia sp.]|jgi:CubicO group peptidase (beta-lactamase class C family)
MIFLTMRLITFAVILLFTIQTNAQDHSVILSNPDDRDLKIEDKYNEVVPKLLKAYAVPSAAIGIIHNGNVIYQKVFGQKSAQNSKAASLDTLFNVGSISKTATAWGVMKLDEKRLIELSNPVESYLTKWQLPLSNFNHNKVTTQALLNHTAGLSMWGVPEFQPSEKVPSIVELLESKTDEEYDVKISHAPNSKWQYSGGGYAILQLLIEEVSKQKFSKYMKEQVFNPLQMNNSTFSWDENTISSSATPHDAAGIPFEGLRFSATSAAGLQTSLPDMLKLALGSMGMSENDNVKLPLSQHSIKLMQTPSKLAEHYGLGYELFEIGSTKISGHSGQNEGWMSQMITSSDNKAGLVILTNGTNGIRIIQELECIWAALALNDECDPTIQLPIKTTESELHKFSGKFIDENGNQVQLNVHHENLFWETDYGYEFALRANKANEFYFVAGENRLLFEVENKTTVNKFVKLRDGKKSYFRRVSH